MQEILVILHEICVNRMIWKGFKCSFKHKRNKTNIQELFVRLRIEEVNNGSENDVLLCFFGLCKCDKIGHKKNHKANKVDSNVKNPR